MAATTKVDFRNLHKKLRKVQREVAKRGEATVQDLLKLGMHNAKKIAPFYTGRTAKLIRTYMKKKSEGSAGIIISPNSTLNDGHFRKQTNFNLVKWMHLTKGYLRGRKHIKSGNPQYMYETARYLKKIKKGVAQGHFNKINIK